MKNARELYEAIINGTEITEEMKSTAAELIGKLDHTNEVRKANQAKKAAEKQAEKAPLREKLFEVIDTEPKTASMLIEAAGLEDVKPASVPSLLRPLVESGTVVKVDIKITGKGTQRGYVKA